MNKSSIIVVSTVIFLVLIGLLYAAGKNQAVAPELSDTAVSADSVTDQTAVQGSVASLTPSKKSYDFGIIRMADGTIETSFTITNPTSAAVTVVGIETSCMCTVAYLEGGAMAAPKGPFGMPGHGGPVARANETIGAGETRTIRVVFDPNAHGPAGVGPIVRQIALSDATGGALLLEIRANVRP